MCLSLEQVDLLKSPLPLEGGHSVRVKGEAKDDAAKQWAQWLVYTEEEPVIDRLNEIDPSWSFEITDKVSTTSQAIIYARLTVCGVSRDCVGNGSREDAEKGAATDALKRGARLFGIGLYLKQAPLIYTDWAPKGKRNRQQEADWEAEAFRKFAAWYKQQFDQPPIPPEPIQPTAAGNGQNTDSAPIGGNGTQEPPEHWYRAPSSRKTFEISLKRIYSEFSLDDNDLHRFLGDETLKADVHDLMLQFEHGGQALSFIRQKAKARQQAWEGSPPEDKAPDEAPAPTPETPAKMCVSCGVQEAVSTPLGEDWCEKCAKAEADIRAARETAKTARKAKEAK